MFIDNVCQLSCYFMPCCPGQLCMLCHCSADMFHSIFLTPHQNRPQYSYRPAPQHMHLSVTIDSLSANLLSRSKTASSARLSSSMRMISPCRMAVTNGPSAHSKGARALAAASTIEPTSCLSLLCSAASRHVMYEYGSLAQAGAKSVHRDGALGRNDMNKSTQIEEVRPAEYMLDKAKSACCERGACKERHQPFE